MSRIVALLERGGRPPLKEVVAKLVAPVRPAGADGPRFWLGSRFALAYQCLRTSAGPENIQPIAAGDLAISFDGRLDNREELVALLAADLTAHPTELSDAALVLACYRRFGEEFARHLNGDFALAIADESQQRLVLARDPIGVRPLYYWRSPETALAASEIKSLLAHPEVTTRPNDLALADLLVGGDSHELRLTCFQDVLRVRPGHSVILAREREREFRHWDFDLAQQVRMTSFGEYAEALRALFAQAVRRRLRTSGSVAVMVSGGLDSSAVLCQAEKLRHSGDAVAPARGISWVFPEGSPADEKVYLTHIEKMYGVEIRKLMFSSFQLADDPAWLWCTEYPRLRWNSELVSLQAARELDCSCVLDGDYGDQMMSSFAHMYDLAAGLRWRELRSQMKALARTIGVPEEKAFFVESLQGFLRNACPDSAKRLIRRIRKARGKEGIPLWFSRPLQDLAYRRRYHLLRSAGPFASRQQGLCYEYFRVAGVLNHFEEVNKMAAVHGLEKAYPFMDRDLAQFLMAIPGEVVNRGGEFKGLFREAMRGILPEEIRLRYSKADFTRLDAAAAASGYPRFEKYLVGGSQAVMMGFLDPEMLQQTLTLHQPKLTGETIFPAAQINALVALELWLRAFLPANLSESHQHASTLEQMARKEFSC